MQKDLQFLLNSLKKSYVFSSLKEQDFSYIIENMFFGILKKDSYLFKQNDQAASFFVLDSGRLELEINEEPIKTFSRGDSFGELALLYNQPRSGSVKALEDSFLWGIEGPLFKKILQETRKREKKENRKFFKRVEFFREFRKHQKEIIFTQLESKSYLPNNRIYLNEETINQYMFVKEGRMDLYRCDDLLKSFLKYQLVDLSSTDQSQLSLYYIHNIQASKCMVVGKRQLDDIFGDEIQNVLLKNRIKNMIHKEPDFHFLEGSQINRIVSQCDIYALQNKTVHTLLEKEGELLCNIYFILEGTLYYGNKVFGKNSIMGMKFIKKKSDSSKSIRHNIYALNCILGYIEIPKMFRIINSQQESLESSLMSNFIQQEMIEKFSEKRQIAKKTIDISQVIYITKLGERKNQFLGFDQGGQQFMVFHFILKDQITSSDEKEVYSERAIHYQYEFPLIAEFIQFQENNQYFLFIREFVFGMSLFDVIRQIEIFDNEEAKFYIGCVMLSLEHLHSKRIIYRDIKPENIIVSETGYPILYDFDTSKMMISQNGRTNTIVGTPHYMAPEVIQGFEYNYSSDLWSLGVLAYELIVGSVPFGEEEEDPFKVYYQILSQKVEFPGFLRILENRQTIRFLAKLIDPNPDI